MTDNSIGAGISVAADIADFRSETGIFKSLMKEYPELKMKTGKELFTWANVFEVRRWIMSGAFMARLSSFSIVGQTSIRRGILQDVRSVLPESEVRQANLIPQTARCIGRARPAPSSLHPVR